MLTPELLEWLRSPEGARLLEEARAVADDPFAAQKLRGHYPAELAAAAVDQVRLRSRARGKFSRAAEMWFSPGLLEQASGEVVARHRARRFLRAGSPEVADLCSGLGGDAVALAEQCRVVAVDRDPLSVALTRANAEALGAGDRVEVRQGELPADAPDVPFAWIDPGRREGGRRTRRLDAMSPSIGEVLELRFRTPNLGIKLSPATPDSELDAALRGVPHEREFISVDGECRELAVWCGVLGVRAGCRRATLLPSGAELVGEPAAYSEVRGPGEWLLEPDAAVIRSGLVANLAERIDAWPIDPELAYLSTAGPAATPFGRWYRIGAVEPFSGKSLAERLRRAEASDVVLKTRGAAVEPERLRQQLRPVLKHGRPGHCPVVFITRLDGRPVMILGEGVARGAE